MNLLLAMMLQAVNPGPQTDVVNPEWDIRPTYQMIEKYYPPAAMEREVQGRAIIQCAVPASGRPERCRVISESPADLGFGQAALNMSVEFLFKPKTVNGKPVEGMVSIPINFTLADEKDGIGSPDRPALAMVDQCIGILGATLEENPRAPGHWQMLTFWHAARNTHAFEKKWGPSDVERRDAQARLKATRLKPAERRAQYQECEARYRQALGAFSLAIPQR